MIYLPDIEKIYQGSEPVKKIMQGEEQVWKYENDEGLIPEYVDCGCIYGLEGDPYRIPDAFITLPFNTSTTLKWRFSGQFLTATGGTHIGAIGLADNNDYRAFMQMDEGFTFFDIGNKRLLLQNMNASHMGEVNYAQWSAKTDLDITFWNNAVYDNIQGYLIKSGTTSTIAPDAEFKLNIHRLKIYAFQAWETSGGTDELIFDGVPKIRYADNQIGLYDNVSKGFYTNSDATIKACYYTLMFKPNWRNASGLTQYTGTTFTLVSGNDGILFTDYSGNVMDAVNREYDGTQGLRWNTVQYDEDGWARFKFDRPLYGIYCGVDTGPKIAFAVVPNTVRVLGGFYGLGLGTPVTYRQDRRLRFFIPEGVEVLTGQCVYGTQLFEYGSVHIPSTVHTIGTAGIRSERDYSSLYPANGYSPKLYYYNGTYDEYNAIDWQGITTYNTGGTLKFSGYPVKCTDGVFYRPK